MIDAAKPRFGSKYNPKLTNGSYFYHDDVNVPTIN